MPHAYNNNKLRNKLRIIVAKTIYMYQAKGSISYAFSANTFVTYCTNFSLFYTPLRLREVVRSSSQSWLSSTAGSSQGLGCNRASLSRLKKHKINSDKNRDGQKCKIQR